MSETKRPQSLDGLVDEALEGFENLLCPITYRAMRNLIEDLYETHPVMRRFADEALGSAGRVPEANEKPN